MDPKYYWILLLLLAIISSFFVNSFFPAQSHNIVLILSIVLLCIGILKIFKYKYSRNWIETQAKIKSIDEKYQDVSLSEYANIKYCYPIVEYEYFIDNKLYLSDSVSFSVEDIWIPEVDTWGNEISKSERPWHKWKSNDEIPVYINPKNPRESVIFNKLSKNRKSHYLAIIASGILCFIIWVWLSFSD